MKQSKPIIKAQKAWAILIEGRTKKRFASCHCHNGQTAFRLFKNKPDGEGEVIPVLITPLTKQQ